MIVEIRPKGTMAFPKEVIKELKLATGDKVELKIVDGVIQLTPVYVVPKKTVKALRKEVSQLKKNAGNNVSSETFLGLDAAVDKLEEE